MITIFVPKVVYNIKSNSRDSGNSSTGNEKEVAEVVRGVKKLKDNELEKK